MTGGRRRIPRLPPRNAGVGARDQPTPEERLVRAGIAGAPGGRGPGPTELRRYVACLVAGDRRALGAVGPIPGLTEDEVWEALRAVFGATPARPYIEPALTIAAARDAGTRLREVARRGGRIAFATSRPASLLALHLALARQACARGADLVELADAGPIHSDGRAGRWLRWVGGVTAVTDGNALYDVGGDEAAREWTFVVPRPSLVVADGPFAEAAWASGTEVIALAGLDRPVLALAAAAHDRCALVPAWLDRAPGDYAALEILLGGPGDDPPAGPGL